VRRKAEGIAANPMGARLYQSSEKKEDYLLHGKKDAFGKVIPGTSLDHLMSLLTDFISKEDTLL
jgi:uncharacterized protein YcgL (UPF0745 family)